MEARAGIEKREARPLSEVEDFPRDEDADNFVCRVCRLSFEMLVTETEY